MAGHRKQSLLPCAYFLIDTDNFRNNFCGFADTDNVSYPDVLILNLIFIMETCPLYLCTGQLDGLEHSYRS